MSRRIGVSLEGGYRAAIMMRDRNGEVTTTYEGIYNQPGTAKARVTFWRGYPDRFVDGWVERATTRWHRLDSPAPALTGDQQIAQLVRRGIAQGLTGSAEWIRRELVCCDIYQRVHGHHENFEDCDKRCDDLFKIIHDSGEYHRHSLCFWGEAAAGLVETYQPSDLNLAVDE